MKRHLKILLLFVWMVPVAGLSGCGDDKVPAKPSKSVSKKIAVQSSPKASAPADQKKDGNQLAKPVADAQTPSSVPEAGTTETSDLVKASLEIASGYDPTGRFDPFEPLFKEQQEEPQEAKGAKKQRRTPKTALERVALSQLKVTAIIRASSGNRALVADATGKGYVVRKGTYIGLNGGQVVAIEKDRILIEEEIESLTGELTIKNAELKLQKPAGEL